MVLCQGVVSVTQYVNCGKEVDRQLREVVFRTVRREDEDWGHHLQEGTGRELSREFRRRCRGYPMYWQAGEKKENGEYMKL